MTREGFAYANLKGFAERKTRRFVHSLYENVSAYSPSVCSEYLNVDDYKDGLTHDFTLKLNVPFCDLLALQAFAEFPNEEVGHLGFKGYFNHKGMVYTFINPATVKDYKEVLQGESTEVDVIDSSTYSNYDHKFVQVGVASTGINDCQYESSTYETSSGETKVTGTITFDTTSFQITKLKSNMAGFFVIQSTKDAIHEVFSKGVFIPSQQVGYATFPIAPSSLGINSTNNLPVSNLSCISIMFPRHDQDYTVFENPYYNNLQLTINGRNIPDETLDTTEARFLHY